MANISKRPDGRWRARYRDDSGREHARHFTRKVDGQRWLREQQTALDRGTWVDPSHGRVTFASYYAEWSQRQVWESSTRKAMDSAIRLVAFADVEIGKVRPSHVEAWVKQMAASYAPTTVRARMAYVRTVFKAAIRDQMVATDPTTGVRLPRQRKREAQMRIPTPDEVRAVLDAADDRFRPFVAVCAFAGLRLGEAAALQVGDVDFLRRTIAVQRQVQRARGVVEVRLPKYGSEREVYVADELLVMIARLVESGIREPWLFSGASDVPPSGTTLNSRWLATCRRAGVEGLHTHHLRHYFASGLIADGCDVVTVQRALGHGNATVTLSVYSHLWPTAADKTRKAAASMMTEVLGATADYPRTDEG
ncbi:MAG: site-specific integrase [Nocardioidaceae bacterium]|nr:site-specific integrase [Nocardioidaceae bacterium]